MKRSREGEGNERHGLSGRVDLVDINMTLPNFPSKRMWLNAKTLVTEDPALKQHAYDNTFLFKSQQARLYPLVINQVLSRGTKETHIVKITSSVEIVGIPNTFSQTCAYVWDTGLSFREKC